MARFGGKKDRLAAIFFFLRGVVFLGEYPAASDCEACGSTYGITATPPSSYWYLRGFDIVSMAEYVDHFSFMAYDIHGTWDADSNYTSAVVNPHTNLTEIAEGFHGRSFTLADESCTVPGCPFDTSAYGNGGGAPGPCTDTVGILTDYEINQVIQDYSPNLVYEEEAAVNWMTWEGNQWVSFDNSKTLKQRADFANARCLGSLFSWALDEGGPAKSYIRGSLLYGNGTSDGTGECYTDGKHAGFGCGVFIKGSGCKIKGTIMQAAYDHLMEADLGGCKICGSVTFSNGCELVVDYVHGCETENNGPAQLINNPFPSIEGYFSSSAKLSPSPSSSSWISDSMGQHGSFLSKISSVRPSPTAYVISPAGNTYTIDASHSASAPAVSPLHSSSSSGRGSSVRALHPPAASNYRSSVAAVSAVSAVTAQSETRKPHGVEPYSSTHTIHPTSTTASIPSPTASSTPLSFANPSAHNSTIPRKGSTSSRSLRFPGRSKVRSARI
ncbi:hypothetical protein BO82DRAFT_428864 [Aspergillus uvarum CBS 121591]|uniref:chitinase n=1 Tax=Aspergillus uvarum CBS 121591 TaxID=1448315 RepID=A0A319E466_9EURO|nr:hypothetical protein BO82DRAFT_428864 [Aspergillus uvarum CBS 121591]PYH85882.1 hypothetical protein BO82DRAFT_428864 [Aspergillus uvarum CBS 121591]